MKTILTIRCVIGMVSFVAAMSFVPAMGQSSEPLSDNAVKDRAPITEPRVAAEAAEDTLQACRARILRDASIDQRRLAEQSCWRDENDRQPFGFELDCS